MTGGRSFAWRAPERRTRHLADVAAAIEVDRTLSAEESRVRIVAAVRERYTAPVSAGARRVSLPPVFLSSIGPWLYEAG